jgi:hypothetical protein
MLFNLVDVGSGMLHWHGNMPVTRFCLGLLVGVAAGSILFSKQLISQTMSGWPRSRFETWVFPRK